MFAEVSTLSNWGWLDIVATGLVAIGVIGESVAFFLKIPFNPTNCSFHEGKKHKAEAWSLIFVAVGVILELVAVPKNIREIATLQGENAQLVNSNLVFAKQVEELREKNNDFESAYIDLEKQAAPRELTAEQAWRLASELADSPSNSVVLVTPPNDDECSDFADDFEATLRMAQWQVSRIERGPLKIPAFTPLSTLFSNSSLINFNMMYRFYRFPKTLHGVLVIHNSKAVSPTARILLGALKKLPEMQLTDIQFTDSPTNEVWLVIATKPPLVSVRSLLPRKFIATQESSNLLARFSWTNTVVVVDPSDKADAATLASQIANSLPGLAKFSSNSMPWLKPYDRPFEDGVVVETPFWRLINQTNGYTELDNKMRRLQDELLRQGEALVDELQKRNIAAKRDWPPRKEPFDWIIVRVGPKPTREESRRAQDDFFSKTNRIPYDMFKKYMKF
jgi:hypothetical protein